MIAARQTVHGVCDLLFNQTTHRQYATANILKFGIKFFDGVI